MTKTDLGNGRVKVNSPTGVKDTRNGMVFREAVVKESDAKYFVEA